MTVGSLRPTFSCSQDRPEWVVCQLRELEHMPDPRALVHTTSQTLSALCMNGVWNQLARQAGVPLFACAGYGTT